MQIVLAQTSQQKHYDTRYVTTISCCMMRNISVPCQSKKCRGLLDSVGYFHTDLAQSNHGTIHLLQIFTLFDFLGSSTT
jgi:hypothetical protein